MKTLDLTGLNCPLPILKAKKFLMQLPATTQILVLTTDKGAETDFQEFCNKTKHKLISQSWQENILHTIIEHK